MQTLAVHVAGPLRVLVDSEERPLPRSRKTRALLAYLALTRRAHPRARLCELFWDVTDDPRGALRWSLSKLRRVLGPRADALQADRDTVSLHADRVDFLDQRGQLTEPIDLPTDTLESIAAGLRGELLSGLELPDFDAFNAWIESARAEARLLSSRAHRELVRRHRASPLRALEHARRWLSVAPNDPAASELLETLSAELDGAIAPASSNDLSRVESSHLNPDAEAVIDWICVAETIRVHDLAALARVEDFDAAVSQGIRTEVITYGEVHGTLTLTDEIRRRERYDALPAARRAWLHGAIALQLARDEGADPSTVAYHHERANRPALAVATLIRGAQQCAAWGEHARAVEMAERALGLVEGLPARVRLEHEIEIRRLLAFFCDDANTAAVADRCVELGLQATELGLHDLARTAFWTAGDVRWDSGNYQGAARSIRQAARVAPLDRSVSSTQVICSRGLCFAMLGREMDEARAFLAEAEAHGGDLEDPLYLLLRGLIKAHAGRWESACDDFDDARLLFRRIGQKIGEIQTIEYHARTALDAGRLEVAAEMARALVEGAAALREGGEGPLGAAVFVLAGRDWAPEMLRRPLAELQTLDDKGRLAFVLNRASRRALLEGDADRARAWAEEALRLAEIIESTSEVAYATHLLLRWVDGDERRAAELDQALAELEQRGALPAVLHADGRLTAGKETEHERD